MDYDLENALNKFGITNVYLHNLLDGKRLSQLMNTSGEGEALTWYAFISDMMLKDILGLAKIKNAKVLTIVGDKTVADLIQKNGKKINVSMASFLSDVTMGDVFGTEGTRGLLAEIPLSELYLTALGRPGHKGMLELLDVYLGDHLVHEFLQAVIGDHGMLHPIFADKTLGDMIILKDGKYTADIDFMASTKVGVFFGYHYDEVTDAWYEDEAFNIPVSGAAGAIAHIPLNKLETEISKLPLGDVFDLHKGEDGIWYSEWHGEGDSRNVKATGVIGAIADFHLDSINDDIQGLHLGNVLDMIEGTDGKWYSEWYGEGDSRNKEATGVMASFAGLTLSDLSNASLVTEKIKTVSLATALGYKKVGTTWYETDADGNTTVPVTPIMGALAEYNIANINSAVDDLKLGTIFGFTQGEDGIWYSEWHGEGDANNKAATGILKALANRSKVLRSVR